MNNLVSGRMTGHAIMSGLAGPSRHIVQPKRHLVCFAISLCQFIGGGVLIICGIIQFIRENPHPFYDDSTTNSFAYGILHCVAGIFGVIAYRPFLRGSYELVAKTTVSPSSSVYIVLALISALPYTIQSNHVYVSARMPRDDWIHTLLVFAVFLGHVIACVGAGFALPDLCLKLPFQSTASSLSYAGETGIQAKNIAVKTLTATNPLMAAVDEAVVASSTASSTHIPNEPAGSASSSKSRTSILLPEVRSHVQEAPGSGEKLTVVTLPDAEGVVYAVPEDSYVICRNGGAYVAPPSNPKLTPFFPSYTKVQVD